MIKIIIVLALIFIPVFLQTINIFPIIFNAKPDIVLIVVINIGLFYGSGFGMSTGFIMGIFEDVLSGGILGLNALTKTLIGYLVGFIGKKIEVESLFAQILFVIIMTFLEGIIIFFLLTAYNKKCNERFILNPTLLTLSIYNTLISAPIAIVIKKIRDKLGVTRVS
ncbi:MAG: rod shape-determining protein MreD [bacterium]